MHLFFYILIPLIVSNILHMIIVKKAWFSSLVIPISEPLFGVNKTLRGFVVVGILNGLFSVLLSLFFDDFSSLDSLWIGGLLGITYMLFELPNSWLKRRLGIAAGSKAEQHEFWFKLLDKMDSSFGVSLVSAWLFGFDLLTTIQFFVLAILIHVSFSWLLVLLGVKKRF